MTVIPLAWERPVHQGVVFGVPRVGRLARIPVGVVGRFAAGPDPGAGVALVREPDPEVLGAPKLINQPGLLVSVVDGHQVCANRNGAVLAGVPVRARLQPRVFMAGGWGSRSERLEHPGRSQTSSVRPSGRLETGCPEKTS